MDNNVDANRYGRSLGQEAMSIESRQEPIDPRLVADQVEILNAMVAIHYLNSIDDAWRYAAQYQRAMGTSDMEVGGTAPDGNSGK